MGQITLIIRSRLEDVLLIGMTVNRLCSQVFSAEETWRIELGVVEAVTNVIKHAYANSPDNEVKVSLEFRNDCVRIKVTDKGCPMDPHVLKERNGGIFCFSRDNIDALPEGGMGIALINQVMDEVCYERRYGKNTLTLTKYLGTAK